MTLYLYDDAHCKHDASKVFCNPNLLINGDFKVWQIAEAFTDKTMLINKYTADRWRVNHTGLTAGLVIVKNFLYGGMSINKSNTNGDVEICQFIENADMYLDKDMVLSFSGFSANTQYNNETTFRLRGDNSNHIITNNDYYFGATYVPSDNVIIVKLGIKRLSSIVLRYLKLEFGKNATPFVPRSYAEELAICQRSCVQGLRIRGVQPFYTGGVTYFSCNGNFPVEMRVTPSILLSNVIVYPATQIPQGNVFVQATTKGAYEIYVKSIDLSNAKYIDLIIKCDSEIY